MLSRTIQSERDSGFTLIEVAIYVFIAALLSGPVVALSLTTERFVAELNSTTKIQERNRVALYRIEQEIRQAMQASVRSDAANALRFTFAGSFDGTAVVPGDTIQYGFQLSPTEKANQVDDDGNGLVDDGVFTRNNLTLNESQVICGSVHLGLSRFAWNGEAVTVTLVNMGAANDHGETIDVSSTLNVYPNN